MMEPDEKMCAVCRRVLDFEMGVYVHPAKDRPADHAAMPIPLGILDPRLRCDFCSADNPKKVLPVRSFNTRTSVSRGDWCCCDICAKLIENGKWEQLIDRVIYTAPPSVLKNHPQARMIYRSLYRQLRANVTGPVRDL